MLNLKSSKISGSLTSECQTIESFYTEAPSDRLLPVSYQLQNHALESPNIDTTFTKLLAKNLQQRKPLTV